MAMTKADKIRDALVGLNNPWATNREVVEYCENRHGYKPSPAMIYETLGAESERKLRQFDGAEMMEVKKTARTIFAGDFQRYADCVAAVASYVR